MSAENPRKFEVKKDGQDEALRKLTENFKNSLPTPEAYENYWQQRLDILNRKSDCEAKVSPCDRTAKEIEELLANGRDLIYVTPKLTLRDLANMHPEMHNSMTFSEPLIYTKNYTSDWVDVDMYIDRPDSAPKPLKQNRLELGMDLITYITASQYSKSKTGKYFDEGGKGFTCIPNCSYKGSSLIADFNADGSLDIIPVSPSYLAENLVYRTRGVAKKVASNNILPNKI